MYKALKKELEKVLSELERISNSGEVHPDLLEEIELINRTLYGLKEGAE